MDMKILGLNTYEEMAYTTLIKIGTSTSGIIAKESGVPYGKIYPTLDSLENKGLIKIIPDKTKKFQASDPKILIDIINKKKEEIKKLENDINNLKVNYEESPVEPISIIKGKNNFYKVLEEMPKPESSDFNITFNSEIKQEWVNEIKSEKRRKIDVKILSRCDNETKENIKGWLKHTKDIREIKNDGVAMSIIDEKFMFVSMIKSNTTAIIRDVPFIKIMKELLTNYYNNSKKIEI